MRLRIKLYGLVFTGRIGLYRDPYIVHYVTHGHNLLMFNVNPVKKIGKYYLHPFWAFPLSLLETLPKRIRKTKSSEALSRKVEIYLEKTLSKRLAKEFPGYTFTKGN